METMEQMRGRSDDNKHRTIPTMNNCYIRTLDKEELAKVRRAFKQFEDDLTARHGYQQAHEDTLITLGITEDDYSYIMEQWSE